MSRFKDEWNERYYQRYETARENGASEREAQGEAEVFANEVVEQYYEAADMARKRAKEEGS